MKRVYLDYAATTPVDPRVVKVMKPYWEEKFGNANSLHQWGREAKEAVEKSRKIIAEALGAEAEEIFFTSSATESNNWAIKGVGDKHLVVLAIEHDSVLESAKRSGARITKARVDKDGLVDPEEIKRAIKSETALVSVMQANNEIGTIQLVKEIGKICREKGVYFQVDAAQSLGKMLVKVEEMKADLVTISAHKVYGPKGVGALYIRKGVEIASLLDGGGQERGLRSGTINVPGIVGFGEAVRLAEKERVVEVKRLEKLRDKLIEGVLEKVSDSYLTGSKENRLANNASFRFAYVEGESIVLGLDNEGIAAATGSACSSHKLKPSHVLLACGLKREKIHGSVRFSLGRWTTEEEIDYVLEVLPKVIEKLRKISPYV